ncbi:calsenilin-like isoform X3 [Paramacrobiotus metropolitanus]|uniref:calsenilin-like isoform X3 n=1 Tax=Paramacrobiotus metropolitanus TaxID=2943436 RepID=UPI00244630B5|nr:calsenilin-like isoform X3 [Paramacrobiotus metropolitanus]
MNALSSIRSAITSFSFRKHADLDDVDQPPDRYVPESLEYLCSITKYSRNEIQLIYRGFKQECPTGLITEDKFKDLYSQFFPLGDARNFAGYVFGTLDTGRCGCITFAHFLVAMSVLTRGNIDEKLTWVFKLYDLNGNGYVSPGEMSAILTSVYDMIGQHTMPAMQKSTVEDHVYRIFRRMDLNGDGFITIEEFKTVCTRDPEMCRYFGAMFDSRL